MASINKLRVKNSIIKLLNEQDESFFYLAPDIVGSVTNADLNFDRDQFNVDFDTTDGRNMKLVVPGKCYNNWEKNHSKYGDKVRDFVVAFLKTSNPIEDDDVMLDEIVDEFGAIMPDEDMPSNGNFQGISRSKFDTDKTIRQTIPKSKRYYGDLGLGIVTW